MVSQDEASVNQKEPAEVWYFNCCDPVGRSSVTTPSLQVKRVSAPKRIEVPEGTESAVVAVAGQDVPEDARHARVRFCVDDSEAIDTVTAGVAATWPDHAADVPHR